MSGRLSVWQRLRRARVLGALGRTQPGQSVLPAQRAQLRARAARLQELAAAEPALCGEPEPDVLAALTGPHTCSLPRGHRGMHRDRGVGWVRDGLMARRRG